LLSREGGGRRGLGRGGLNSAAGGRIFGKFLAAFLLAAMQMLFTSCGKHEQEPAKGSEKGEAKAGEKSGAQTESRVSHGTNGEVIITLDADTQKRMGLAVAPLTTARMAPEAKGYARVQDMSWLGSTISDLQAARIAANAARNELARLRKLREQNNASEKALQAAEATAAHEETNLKTILVKVQAMWGKKLADLVGGYAFTNASPLKPDPLPM